MTERLRQLDRRRHGSAYVMILGVSAVLMVIGLAAVSVARIDTRNVSSDNDWSEAQTLALSAAENALARIAVTEDWRSRLGGVFTAPMGRGTMQWQITDDGDGQLADDEQDPVLIVAIGQVGASRYKLGLRCFVEGLPLEALSRCVHCGGDITMDKDSQLTVIGGAACAMFGGVGSAAGIRISASQAAGVMSEKPELFGRMLVLIALPGTQGFYAFVTFFVICWKAGLLGGGPMDLDFVKGLGLMLVGICSGVVQWRSAISQGETSAAAISLVARKPEEAGRAIILPALVETYAVVALLTALLATFWIAGKA